MKKKSTVVVQPEKTETVKAVLTIHHTHIQKFYRNHSLCDHPHGRVNRYPFGSSYGPEAF